MASHHFGYDKPTEATIIADLAEVVGAQNARELVDMACRTLRLSRPVDDVNHLIAVTETLTELGDLVRVAARSVKIRAITYRALGNAALH